MKARTIEPRESSGDADREAQTEIQSFLKALDSYPNRFALEPRVSFEQHLRSLARAGDSRVGSWVVNQANGVEVRRGKRITLL
jgi:hypothetical protein